MTIEEKVHQYMNTKHPEKGSLKVNCLFYADVQFTHESFRLTLNNAPRNTSYYTACYNRAFDWLVTLKQNNIALIDNNN